MTQTQALKKMRRAHWIELEKLLKVAYQDGIEAGAGAVQEEAPGGEGETGEALTGLPEAPKSRARLGHGLDAWALRSGAARCI